jgi:NodT family efflux transporter outer membrane factor (OMF) lipoprotein
MMPPSFVRRQLSRVSLLLLAACAAVGPDYQPPQQTLSPRWREAIEAGLAAKPVAEAPFWRSFDDPLLTQLVEAALQQNLDLRSAFARLRSAAALRGVAAAERWPTFNTRASFEDRQESRNTPFGAFIPRTNIHAVAVDAAWELDLWGRVRRSVEAADRDLDASAADVSAAALSVAADVVTAYVDLRASQRRLRIARDNLELQQQSLGLAEARQSAGLVVERDVAQAMTNVESTRARLPALTADVVVAQNRLAVLLGKAPGQLPFDLDQPGELPKVSAEVAVGAPADLLRRRPDVHAAERRFAAAVARIGVAEGERYPQFTLGGTFGFAANAAKDVFTKGSDVIGFGPSVRWNLFDGGRLKQRVASLTADAEVAQIAWEQAVLRAVEDTEAAMTRYQRERERRTSLAAAASQASRAVELARGQYRAGLTDFQAVIDSERTVAAIEDDLVVSEAAIAGGLVSLFKALGGGVLPTSVPTEGAESAPPAASPARAGG